MIEIIQGDALEKLKLLPDESVDCVITSPPYWQLRFYKGAEKIWGGDPRCDHDFSEKRLYRDRNYEFCMKCGGWYGQLGCEPTVQLFIEHLIEIFREVKRVLKKTGNFFIVIGDTYVGGARGKGHKDKSTGIQRAPFDDFPRPDWNLIGIPEKNLALIPERLAIAMQDDGWIIRDMIVWAKKVYWESKGKNIGNALPESVKTRFSRSYEFIIHAVKSPFYYFYKLTVPIKENTVNRFLHGKKPGKYDREGRKYIGTITTGKTDSIKELINSKFLQEDFKLQNSGSIAARIAWGFSKGKVESVVRKALLNVGGLLRRKKEEKGFTIKEIAELTGIEKTTLEHYFRTDISGGAIPSKVAWERLKPILDLPEYEEVITEEIRNSFLIDVQVFLPNTLLINPAKLLEAHYAPFPERLVEILIEAGNPQAVCASCGTPYFPAQIITNTIIRYFKVKKLQEYEFNGSKFIKLCNCSNLEIKQGVVLDPFAGSGTVGVVCKGKGIDCILIEISKDYCEIIEKRLQEAEKVRFRKKKKEEKFQERGKFISQLSLFKKL